MAAYTILLLLRPAPQGAPGGRVPGWEFLMVRNRRRGNLWELPGGRCAPGEGAERCARRECEEETGHRLVAPRLLVGHEGRFGRGSVFAGRLGPRVRDPDAREISAMHFVADLPPPNLLSFPNDPYEAIFARLRAVDLGGLGPQASAGRTGAADSP